MLLNYLLFIYKLLNNLYHFYIFCRNYQRLQWNGSVHLWTKLPGPYQLYIWMVASIVFKNANNAYSAIENCRRDKIFSSTTIHTPRKRLSFVIYANLVFPIHLHSEHMLQTILAKSPTLASSAKNVFLQTKFQRSIIVTRWGKTLQLQILWQNFCI